MYYKKLEVNSNTYHMFEIAKNNVLNTIIKENPRAIFRTLINNVGNRPFFTILAKIRREHNIPENSVVVLRIKKGAKIGEFIRKVKKWGKIDCPKNLPEVLGIKNHENIEVQIISKDGIVSANRPRAIDLAEMQKLDNASVIERNKGFITIWKKGKTPLTLSRFVKITDELVEASYLILGDGRSTYKLSFSNKLVDLHNFVLNTFKSVEIPRDIWRCRIIHKNPEKRGLQNFWVEKLNFANNQFYPSVSGSNFNTNPDGVVRIVIDKTIICDVFRFLVNQVNVIMNKKQSFHALNGLLAAEGSALIDSIGLHRITLSFNQKEKNMFEEILEKTDLRRISTIKENRMFEVSKWNNLYQFFEIFVLQNIRPFGNNRERSKNAILGFLRHRRTKALRNYLEIISRNPNKPFRQIAKLSKRNDKSVRLTLLVRCKGFIKCEMKKHRRLVSISIEGKKFLKLVRKLEKWLPEVEKMDEENLNLLKSLEVR